MTAQPGTGGRRRGVWLWTLLHAQVLVYGTIGPEDPARIEDDRQRLAGRRAR